MTTDHDSLQPLLAAVRELVPCDAVVLLRLEGDRSLVPVAFEGLDEAAVGRRFSLDSHERLAQLAASAQGLRFAADCGLPDPYDGLLAGQEGELLAVHDCMGCPLRHEGKLWGVVTLDALDPHAFDAVGEAQRRALTHLLEAGIGAHVARQQAAERDARERVLAHELRGTAPTRQLLGKSPALLQLLKEIDTVAPSELTVLILGETGVGKELVAQRLHVGSPRRDAALIQVNCAALPETLADSELFGHKKGAFTGAVQDRIGKFELANGGTLFLDEIGELPLSVQAKLLRVLQSGELQRPGSDRTRHVDVRVIAATNRNLKQEVAEGRFRADLYHRLSVYPVWVPPLRERGSDVLLLAEGFLEENQRRLGARNLRMTPAARAALLQHDWPGNVRELEHLVSRAALRALSEQGRAVRWISIDPELLGLRGESTPQDTLMPRAAASDTEFSGPSLKEATEDFQRRWIEAALARYAGSMSLAAREAGMDRSNLYRLARRLGVAATRSTGTA